MVKTWAFVLQDIPADICTLAFMQVMAVSKWLPTPAEIREQCKRMYVEASTYHFTHPNLPKDEQGDRVRQYICDSTQHLSGPGAPELSLDTIMRRGYGKDLGISGEQRKQIEKKEKDERIR